MLGPTPVRGLSRAEPGNVLTQNLGRLVTLQSPRPCVPSYDVSLRVEHEDGIFLCSMNQQTKLPPLTFRSLFVLKQFDELAHLRLNNDRKDRLDQKVHRTECISL